MSFDAGAESSPFAGPNFGSGRCIGFSEEGRRILVHGDVQSETGGTLLIGGMHGDEIATIVLLEDFMLRHADLVGREAPVAILPVANPDGYERLSRYNARRVDLNRNFETNWSSDSLEPSGAAAWSEPESRALRDFILAWRPKRIVSLHWALAEIDADGVQSTAVAQAMWSAMNESERRPYRLRITEDGRGLRSLGQTNAICPGSLGLWAGYGLVYPDGSRPAMITLELPYDPAAPERPEVLPEEHLEALRGRWRRDPGTYLRAIEPAVHKMLLAACEFIG